MSSPLPSWGRGAKGVHMTALKIIGYSFAFLWITFGLAVIAAKVDAVRRKVTKLPTKEREQ